MEKIMKAIGLSILLLGITTLNSCNEEHPNVEIKQDEQFSKLSTELENYTKSFFLENENKTIDTRAGASTWIMCAVADYEGGKYGAKIGAWCGGIHGAVSGALFGGIFLSACAALSNQSFTYDHSKYNDYTIGSYQQYNDYEYIGDIHNDILIQLIKDKNNYCQGDSINRDLLFSAISGNLEKYEFTNGNIVFFNNNRHNIYNEYKEFEIIRNKNLDTETTINLVFDKLVDKYPEEKASINISRNYISNAVKIKDESNLIQYASGYEKIVSTSNISPEHKADILGNISLGKQSQLFWSSQLSE